MNYANPGLHLHNAFCLAADRDLADSRGRLPPLDALRIHVFQQRWPNTGCGRGGVVCRAITVADTVVIAGPDRAAVYINNWLAYRVDLPNAHFEACLAARDMPGHEHGVRYYQSPGALEGKQ